MTKRRQGVGAAVAAVAAMATIVLSAMPASAVTRNCRIPVGHYGCSTSSIPANATTHQIGITAIPGNSSRAVTCRAHDSVTGDVVGTVSASPPFSRSKTIGGLYGRYFLSCVGPTAGGGSIYNG